MRGILCGCALLGLCVASPDRKLEPTSDARADSVIERHRSPIEVVVLPGGKLAVTANHTSDSISLVDLHSGKVVEEKRVDRGPAGLAVSRDGRRVAVSNLWSGSVSLFEVRAATLEPRGQVAVGSWPRGLVFDPNGGSLWVALSGTDEIVQVLLQKSAVGMRLRAPREPRHLAISADGSELVAVSSRSSQVRCWDLPSGKVRWERTIGDGFNLRGPAFDPSGTHVVCAHVVRRDFPVTKQNIEEGWVIDSRLSRLALKADAVPNTWQIALDTKGEAVGDPHGLAFGSDFVALTAGGTHELLLLETAAIPWNSGDPGDFLDAGLRDGKKLRRVPLGGRPLGLAVSGEQVIVANYLLDAVQVVDARRGKLVRTIALGGPRQPSLARQGEALFYDARRSHNQWFSCHTCHVDGHTCGLNFDTLNDDSYGTPKLTPSLRNVTRTGPWTWHGSQNDLGAAVTKSLTQTMFGPRPSAEEVKALLAFLETLEAPLHPRAKGRDEGAVRRGREIFENKAKCDRCHQGPYYTSAKTYDVGLESDGSPHKLWNPPSLLGLYLRGPYFHDGRARTLDELLQKHHTPEMIGGHKISDAERGDLIAFLLSL